MLGTAYRMKHKGSCFEYEEQRNNDLMRAYRHQVNSCPLIDKSIYRRIVDMPSCRFWVSEERAKVVISAMMRGVPIHQIVKRPTSQEMFTEIHANVISLRELHPHLSLSELVFMACSMPASKFFMTPLSALVIISRIKRKARKHKDQ